MLLRKNKGRRRRARPAGKCLPLDTALKSRGENPGAECFLKEGYVRPVGPESGMLHKKPPNLVDWVRLNITNLNHGVGNSRINTEDPQCVLADFDYFLFIIELDVFFRPQRDFHV